MTTQDNEKQPSEPDSSLVWTIVNPENSHERIVELVRGVEVHLPITAEAEDDGLVWCIEVDVIDGRLGCTRLEVHRQDGGPAISSEIIRSFPVARHVHHLAMRNTWGPPEPSDSNPFAPDFVAPPTKTTAELLAEGPTDDALAHVASVYRLAFISGMPPTKAVVDLGLTRPTASRWLRAAKKKGLL